MSETLGIMVRCFKNGLRPRCHRAFVLVGVAVVGLLCGCGASTREKAAPAANAAEMSQRWATPAELKWLKRVGRYTRRFGAEIDARPTARTAATCHPRLVREVASPPTPRLQPVFTSLDAACTDLVRYFKDPSDRLANDYSLLVNRARAEGEIGIERRLPSARGVVDTLQGGADASHTDPLFNAAASAVARKHVDARCWSERDWPHLSAEVSAIEGGSDYVDDLGFALPGGDEVNLSPFACGYLDLLVLGGPTSASQRDFGIALSVLAHEAEHARGVVSEKRTQCYGMQMVPTVAERLGLSAVEARHFTDAVWKIYQRKVLGVWSAACKPGGPYDLHLHDPHWP